MPPPINGLQVRAEPESCSSPWIAVLGGGGGWSEAFPLWLLSVCSTGVVSFRGPPMGHDSSNLDTVSALYTLQSLFPSPLQVVR